MKYRVGNMNRNKFQLAGWGFVLYGAYLSVLSLFTNKIIGLILFNNTSFEIMSFSLIICAYIYNFSMFFCGYYLLKYNYKIHKFAILISILSLANPPVGTLIGTIYLLSFYKYRKE